MKIIPTTDLIAPRLAEFATACGEALARAHARTGDPVAIDGYIGQGARLRCVLSSGGCGLIALRRHACEGVPAE
jgi:hypothetical protein